MLAPAPAREASSVGAEDKLVAVMKRQMGDLAHLMLTGGDTCGASDINAHVPDHFHACGEDLLSRIIAGDAFTSLEEATNLLELSALKIWLNSRGAATGTLDGIQHFACTNETQEHATSTTV